MSNLLVWDDLVQRAEDAAIAFNGVLLPVGYPNTDFLPPSPPRPWLFVEINGGSDDRMELGASSPWLDRGQSMVHIFVETGTGARDAFLIVDQVKKLFKRITSVPVTYTSISAEPGGPGTEDGAFWRTSVTGDWQVQNLESGE